MRVADIFRRFAGRAHCARRLRGHAVIGGAILLSIGLSLHPGGAAEHGHSSHGHNNNNNSSSSNDNNDDHGSSGGSSSAGSNSSSGGGLDSNSGGAGSGGATLGGTISGGNRSGGASDSGLFAATPGSGQPSIGVGFNNSGGSVRASFPLGGDHANPLHANQHVSHPMLSLPFGHTNSLASSLARPSLAHMDTAGTSVSPLGGSPALTSKLIHSVTSTLSNRFINTLGRSLRAQASERGDAQGAPGAAPGPASKTASATSGSATSGSANAASRSPAALVRDRFAAIGGNAFEPRQFTIPLPGETHFVPNEVVVGVPSALSRGELDALARRNGLAHVDSQALPSSGLTLHRWRIADQRSVPDAIRALEADADVQSAQPNYRFALAQQAGVSETVTDTFSTQYVPAKLHLAPAHRLTRGQDVLVAVIDTGIDRLHPEIAGSIAGSFDAIGASEPPDIHGTGIAGAIVAHGRLTGTAPAARLLAIRAFSTAGPDVEATTMTIVRSVEWAMAQGARVINMSFAGARDPVIGRSLATARRKGIVLVAAAGNAGPQSAPLYPAADPNVIAVSATDVDDRLLDVSNRGRHIALAAPGVDVLLPAPGARYQIATGTSFAAAHVAGIAALLISRNPRLTPEAVRNVLIASARDLGPKGRDDRFGAGLADAYKAVVSLTADSAQTVASNASAVP